MSANNLIKGLSVLGKVTVTATPTVFSDQVSVSITIDPQLLEAVTTGQGSWKGRDVEIMDWGGTIRVFGPTAGDNAMDEVRAGAIGGIKKTFTFVIPTSTPITLSGDAFIRMTMTGEQGSYYSEEYELLPDGALTES